MATLGLLQYLAPSLQLLIGVWIYHEPFTGQRALGYAVIWSALLVYTLEGLWRAHRRRLAGQ
jgi:chloramphenicol-sensitive protein RarD